MRASSLGCFRFRPSSRGSEWLSASCIDSVPTTRGRRSSLRWCTIPASSSPRISCPRLDIIVSFSHCTVTPAFLFVRPVVCFPLNPRNSSPPNNIHRRPRLVHHETTQSALGCFSGGIFASNTTCALLLIATSSSGPCHREYDDFCHSPVHDLSPLQLDS